MVPAMKIATPAPGPNLRSRPRTALFLAVIVTVITAASLCQAQTFTVLHDFTGNQDGGGPMGVTVNSAGVLFGATVGGGTLSYQCPYGCGTVFKLKRVNSAWILSNLYNFQGLFDGLAPGQVTLAPDGTIYGTSQQGLQQSNGVVYHLTPPATPCHSVQCYWTLHSLYRFDSGYSGGAYPTSAALALDQSGHLYGMTRQGGTESCGCGTVYQVATNGSSGMVLHSFNGTDGQNPGGGVILDPVGNLYGTTVRGGTYNWGVVFQLSNSDSGWVENILYPFDDVGELNGAYPSNGVVRDAAGNLYGAASAGGSQGGGTAFELVASSGYSFSLLYSFHGTDGGGSRGSLTMGPDGSLYGATLTEGLYSKGAVFKLTPQNGTWIYTSLHDFTGGSDGANPLGDLVLDSQGNIYGVAGGGMHDRGLVFEITP
jgi:uncharacterized repeat protein (TIGR03803 family)